MPDWLWAYAVSDGDGVEDEALENLFNEEHRGTSCLWKWWEFDRFNCSPSKWLIFEPDIEVSFSFCFYFSILGWLHLFFFFFFLLKSRLKSHFVAVNCGVFWFYAKKFWNTFELFSPRFLQVQRSRMAIPVNFFVEHSNNFKRVKHKNSSFLLSTHFLAWLEHKHCYTETISLFMKPKEVVCMMALQFAWPVSVNFENFFFFFLPDNLLHQDQ